MGDVNYSNSTASKIACALTAVISFGVYYATCFPTITWWDSADYSTAASCLGITGPPGSLLAVIVGWIITRPVPWGAETPTLNLFAGLLGAATVAIVGLAGLRLLDNTDVTDDTSINQQNRYITFAAAVIGSLTLSFSATLWLHSTKFTPYIFTACLTSVIVLLMLRWWRRADEPLSWKILILVVFLLGLDFSIHRTNLLLAPGLVVFVLLRQPGTLGKVKIWIAGFISLAAGLSFHFLIIPIAARHPYMNFNNPGSLSTFWDYISLKQYGGGWLLSLFPRKAPFWSYQVVDYLKVFAANFFSTSGKSSVLGIIPTLFALIGLLALWRRNWRLTIGLLALFLCASLGAVLYFNIPPGFFRPFDRHYLPSFVIAAVFIIFGLGAFLSWVMSLIKNSRWLFYGLVVLLLLCLPIMQIARNFKSLNGSKNYFALDFGKNILATLPPNSIIFTFGDNDTYPLWYLQSAEKMRPDVTVLNIWLLNTPWYVKQMMSQDPRLPLTLTDSELVQIAPKPWKDTTIAVPITGTIADYQLPDTVRLSDSASFRVPPTQSNYMLVHDWLTLRIVTENRWQRPIYFSAAGGESAPVWVQDHLRPEGLASRLMPVSSPPLNTAILENNLLNVYSYRGYADKAVTIDITTPSITPLYFMAFLQLVMEGDARHDILLLRKTRDDFFALMPPDRLQPLPPNLQQGLDNVMGK